MRATLAVSLFLCVVISAVATSRGMRAEKAAEAALTRGEAAAVRATEAELVARELVGFVAQRDRDVRTCAARTEWLRIVMDVLVHEADWPARNRERLPDPPPGWAAFVIPEEPVSWREATR
jgi:hypothetical protein